LGVPTMTNNKIEIANKNESGFKDKRVYRI
jgi:hypothetical protein